MYADIAFILHKRAYRESSDLIKFLTMNHGIVDVIAKGSRKPKSKFSGHLQNFLSTEITFTGRSSLKTLTDASQQGSLAKCPYKSHVSMLYCSELLTLLRLENESCAEIFNAYQKTIQALQQNKSVSLPLRKFEWVLSRILGYELLPPSEATENDYLQFDPHLGLQVNNQVKICSMACLNLFLAEKAMEPTEIKQLNRLMKTVVNHLVHGKEIQSRQLL